MGSKSPTISSDPLARYFDEWRTAQRKVLIPYVTAGYPRPAEHIELLRVIDAAGADVIELGVPFSDPVADGPTIQRSSQRALEQGVTLEWTLDALGAFRRTSDTPVIIFTYLNPLLNRGVTRFIEDAVHAGAQGVLVVDLPLGADPALETELEESPLSLIRLLAPTTAPERALEVAAHTQGFLYYVARLGVTGARGDLRSTLLAEVSALKQKTDVPIAVGFGVSTPEHAQEIASVADAVIVGSALIDAIDRGGAEAAGELISSLRTALDSVP